jgi:phosphatidylglycerophosphate synthase
MNRLSRRICIVDAISLSRLVAALMFASMALQRFSPIFIGTVYLLAALTDFFDGYVAKKLNAATFAGKVIDLISDKSLTIVSLLYAAVRGVDIFPLALIGIREIIVLGARIINIDGRQLLPTSRPFGGIMATILWGNTLLLIFLTASQVYVVNVMFWGCAGILIVNLTSRLIASRSRIRRALEIDR